MKAISILDENFANSSGHPSNIPKTFLWDKINKDGESIFITDNYLFSNKINFNEILSKRKIAWLLEPRVINPQLYNLIKRHNWVFNDVLTHDHELVSLGKNFKWVPVGGCWVTPFNENKYKNISIIASNKNFTIGHKLRHRTIENVKNVDVFGNGYRYIESKETALHPYRFSICIENCQVSGYFTEKLIDCFISKTIPIYWGDPSISNHFNTDGMIIVNDLDEIKVAINCCSEEKYGAMYSALLDNFKRAQKFLLAEDWIFEKYPEFFN